MAILQLHAKTIAHFLRYVNPFYIRAAVSIYLSIYISGKTRKSLEKTIESLEKPLKVVYKAINNSNYAPSAIHRSGQYWKAPDL